MKQTRRILSAVLALTMALGCMTSVALGESGAKWTSETTKDGWIKITQEGGKTLGYSPDSGVTIIEDDGFAFKDLNKNGQLDVYEDWRVDAETRAADLAGKMTGKEIVPLTIHYTWAYFGDKIGEDDLVYLQKGGRDGLSRSSSYEGTTKSSVKWNNLTQAYAEKEGGYGIPSVISMDPYSISNVLDSLGLASTMNTELAHQIGVEASKEFRSTGVTMVLGPQIDLVTTPVLKRGFTAYSEDPALTADIAAAFIDGLQSTYDTDGNDLGWGSDSVVGVAKHFAGAGASEGGRNDHDYDGKFTVYPNDAFQTHLIPFFNGAFKLHGKTESAAGVMTNYAVPYSEDGTYGELVGGVYSEFKLNILKHNNYDNLIISDWGIITSPEWSAAWGVEDLTPAECFAHIYKLGVDQIGGSTVADIDSALAGYQLLVDEMGEADATELLRTAAYQTFKNKFNLGIFENPYLTTEYAVATAWTAESMAFGDSTQQQAVMMLKNNGNLIKPYDVSAKKLTAYIPYTIEVSGGQYAGYTYSCVPSVNIEEASNYYNVVTDSVGEPTGMDENGETIYTANDIVRATADDIASCDIAIVRMCSPFTGSYYDADADLWFPPSLQYEEYTADSEFVRQESISGEIIKKEIKSVYGTNVQEIKENRSYYGNTSSRARTYGSYETLQFVNGAVSDTCKIIVAMDMMQGAMVWSEVEPVADVIVARYKDGALFAGDSKASIDVLFNVIVGAAEPNALLPMQQPANMEAVEKQSEDLPRDMECYVDANGNTYDFAFGLNWSGVINDERVAKYNVPALTEPATQLAQ